MTLLSFFLQQKNKKGGGEGNLPSSSHFYHHLEAFLVGAFLKLPIFETHVDFVFLQQWGTQTLSSSEALVIEMNTKRGGWGKG